MYFLLTLLLTLLLNLLLLLLSYPIYPILYLLFIHLLFFVVYIISFINYNIITYFIYSVTGIKLFDIIAILIPRIIPPYRYSYKRRVLRFTTGTLGLGLSLSLLNRLGYLIYLIRKNSFIAKRTTLF